MVAQSTFTTSQLGDMRKSAAVWLVLASLVALGLSTPLVYSELTDHPDHQEYPCFLDPSDPAPGLAIGAVVLAAILTVATTAGLLTAGPRSLPGRFYAYLWSASRAEQLLLTIKTANHADYIAAAAEELILLRKAKPNDLIWILNDSLSRREIELERWRASPLSRRESELGKQRANLLGDVLGHKSVMLIGPPTDLGTPSHLDLLSARAEAAGRVLIALGAGRQVRAALRKAENGTAARAKLESLAKLLERDQEEERH